MFIIAGLYKGLKLKTPKGSQTRPTSSRLREAVFNICQFKIEGCEFLDLFAGSGAMGLEAISRRAQSITFVDNHRECIQCIKENIKHLKIEKECQILQLDIFKSLEYLARNDQSFDIIYADPPYHQGEKDISLSFNTRLIEWIDTHALLKPEGVLFIEENLRYPPHLKTLNTLKLKESRKFGTVLLQQYQKI